MAGRGRPTNSAKGISIRKNMGGFSVYADIQQHFREYCAAHGYDPSRRLEYLMQHDYSTHNKKLLLKEYEREISELEEKARALTEEIVIEESEVRDKAAKYIDELLVWLRDPQYREVGVKSSELTVYDAALAKLYFAHKALSKLSVREVMVIFEEEVYRCAPDTYILGRFESAMRHLYEVLGPEEDAAKDAQKLESQFNNYVRKNMNRLH